MLSIRSQCSIFLDNLLGVRLKSGHLMAGPVTGVLILQANYGAKYLIIMGR